MNINAPLQGRGLAIPFTKAADPEAKLGDKHYRLPFLNKIPDGARNHFVAMCGEFVGTFLFLFFALSGTQVANNVHSSSGLSVQETGANPQQLQYISLCFGFSLAVNAWVFFRISGGLFNPAVTFGMCLIGALPWFRGVLLFFVQIIAGIAAAAIVMVLFPGPLKCRTSLGGGTTVVQGLFIEMFLTAQLVFTIFMLAAEKHKGTFIAPVGIGLSLFVAELTGVYFTGGSLNPARSFGPAVATAEFYSYHWLYWVGPILGSIVAAGFYKFIKTLEYETANPGQDANHASKVEEKRKLLIAAGVNEADAHQVATDLVLKSDHTGGDNGGPDQTVVANGQGRYSEVEDKEGMYGTRFASDSENGAVHRDSLATEQRPIAVTSGSQAGRFAHIGRNGSVPSVTNNSAARVDSPAMATHDEIYAPLQAAQPETLGGGIAGNETRSRYHRTASSGV